MEDIATEKIIKVKKFIRLRVSEENPIVHEIFGCSSERGCCGNFGCCGDIGCCGDLGCCNKTNS